MDAVIKRCEDPWNNILKGMGWKAVASLSEEELKQKLAMPKKKEEKQDDKGKKADSKQDDKGKGQGGDDRGQGGDGQGRDDGSSGGGSGPQGPQVDPPELPDEEELEPEEEIEEEPVPEKLTLGERFRNWREKRREMKAEKAKREIETYGKKLGILDRLSLKMPWLGKILKRDVKELSLEEQLEEAGIPRVHTEEELKKAEAIRARNREALGRYEKIDEEQEYWENLGRKSLEDLIALRRKGIEEAIDVFGKEEIEKAYGGLWIAQGYFKDAKDIEEMWNRGKAEDDKEKINLQYLPIPDKTDLEEVRKSIEEQLTSLSVEEIAARQDAWLGLKIFKPEEIKVFSDEARDRTKEAKARRARIEARKAAEQNKDNSVRSAHREFADRINGGSGRVVAPGVVENDSASGEPQRAGDVVPVVGDDGR